MKNSFIFLLLLSVSALCVAMDDGQEHSAGYKHHYNMEYTEARGLVGNPMKDVILVRMMEQEMQKRLPSDVLNPRIDALMDLYNGCPNKFEEQAEEKRDR